MRKVTIRDVAKAAGVSLATVSRVFNNKFDAILISEGTRKRVLEAADELGYTPNAIARSLVSQRTNIVGLVVPDIVHSYFPEITRGVESLAYDHCYQIILCDSQEDLCKEEEQIRMLSERQCDGIIVALVSTESRKNLDLLIKRDVPFVLIDRYFGDEFDYVGTDSYAGARIAVEYLLSLGHKKIAHIRGPLGISSSEDSVKGYLDALNEAGAKPNDAYICGKGFYEKDGTEAMRELLALDERPTAVFAANDPLALGALHALDESNLHVPDDISIIGSGNLSVTPYLKSPLTTLNEHPQGIGETAMDILCKKLHGYQGKSQQIRIVPELIIRQSCKDNTI